MSDLAFIVNNLQYISDYVGLGVVERFSGEV